MSGVFQDFENADDVFLGVADIVRVDEVSGRFRIVHDRPAGDNQRMVIVSLGCFQGYPGQIENIKHVGVDHLVSQGEPDHVEFVQRTMRFQREHRDIFPAHELFGVAIRGEKAFADKPLIGIDQMIENLHAEIGHTDFVHVGIADRHGQFVFMGFDDLPRLTAGVSSGFDDVGKEFGFEKVLHIPIA